MAIEEINGRYTCTVCTREWSAMASEDEIPERCGCADDEKLPVLLTQREIDTVIAALRLWQHTLEGSSPDLKGLYEIADNGRLNAPFEDAHLDADDVGGLCEDLGTNTRDVVAWHRIGSTHHGLTVWMRDDQGTPMYQVSEGKQPTGRGGYFDLDTLLKLKGDMMG